MRTLTHSLKQCKKEGKAGPELLLAVQNGMEQLVTAFVKDSLEPCSDIKYDEKLVSSLLAAEDFEGLLSSSIVGDPEYAIRKHLRSIIRAYMSSINQTKRIHVTDRAQFGKRIGLSFGWSSDVSRTHCSESFAVKQVKTFESNCV